MTENFYQKLLIRKRTLLAKLKNGNFQIVKIGKKITGSDIRNISFSSLKVTDPEFFRRYCHCCWSQLCIQQNKSFCK